MAKWSVKVVTQSWYMVEVFADDRIDAEDQAMNDIDHEQPWKSEVVVAEATRLPDNESASLPEGK